MSSKTVSTPVLTAALLLAGWLTCPSPATAQSTQYWDPGLTDSSGGGGAGTWGAAANWFNGTADTTWVSGNIANFGGTAGTVTLGTAENADGLAFTSSGYTISGSSTLTLGGSAPTITIPSGGAEIINCILAGSAGLAESLAGSSGTLILGATNTYSGGATVPAGGTLQIDNGAAAGASSGAITLDGNGILNVFFKSPANTTLANSIVGGSTCVINVNQSNNTFFTGSFAGFSGTINLNTGPGTPATGDEVLFDGVGTAASFTAGTVINVATGQTCAIAVSPAPTVSATIILNGPGNTVGYGALRIDNGNLAGPVFLAGTNSWIGSDGGNLTISGPISDTNSGNGIVLVARSTGTRDIIVFAGANTYTGLTTLSNGTLRLGAAENPGISGPLGSSTVLFVGTGSTVPGLLQYSSANQYDYSGRFSAAAGQNYIIDVNGQSVTFASPLTSAGAPFTLEDTAGGGTLTLAATNTYSGGTTISSGTLVAGAFGAIPGNVTVTGGTLVGNAAGGVAGNVTVTSGTLTLSNASALSAFATVSVPVSGPVNLNFTGTQTIAALYIGGAQQAPGVYDAVTNNPGGAFSGSGLLAVVVPTYPSAYWDANGTDASSQSSANGGGTGGWNNTASDWWVSGNSDTTWPGNYIANFAGTAGTVTLSVNETTEGLDFATSGYILTGASTLTLGGATPTITVPSGGIDTIGVKLAGTQGLTEGGTGTIVLSGTNTYTGATTVGTLMISGSGELGGGDYLYSIDVTNALIDDSSMAQTWAGVISDSGYGGALSQEGAGTLTLSGANTYSGGTFVNSNSTLLITSVAGAGTGTVTITNTGILTVNLSGGSLTWANALAGASNAVVNFGQSANTFLTGDYTFFNGTINLIAGGSPGDEVIANVPSPLNLPSNATWNVATGQTLAISFVGAVNNAMVVLHGRGNTGNYGAFRLDYGTQAGNVLLAGTNNWIGSDGGDITISGVISDSGSGNGLVITSGNVNTRDIIMLSGANTYTGVTTLSNGTLQVASPETPGINGPLGTSSIFFAGGGGTANNGTLQFSSANNYDYSGRFSTAANQAMNIDVNGQTVAFASPLTSAGGNLTLSDSAGGGTLILSAVATFSGGGVNVTSGTLDITNGGSLLGQTNIIVNGGTLEFDNGASLAANAMLTVNSGTVDLTYAGTQFISALSIGGSPQTNGVYGANFDNPNGVFAGPGSLAVGPALQISSATVTDNQFTVSWASISGVNYNVYTSTNLTRPWTLVTPTPITASGQTTTFTLAGSVNTNSQLFVLIQQ